LEVKLKTIGGQIMKSAWNHIPFHKVSNAKVFALAIMFIAWMAISAYAILESEKNQKVDKPANIKQTHIAN
jgi:hypothetical protein